VAMEKLDPLITDHLIERLFKPDRLAAILGSLASRRAKKVESLSGSLMALQQAATDDDGKPKRLYRLSERGGAKEALEKAKEHLAPQIRIDPALIENFGRTMRENFSTGSVPFRKAYL